jgi:N-methylhydantoinase A
MERALRVISVERGYDPVDFALVAFGGAGGLHVAELAQRLGAARALVPPDPGLLSAYGMLASPVTREVSRTVLLDTEEPGIDARLDELLEELEREARQGMANEGIDPAGLTAERRVDARYRGQSFELSVPAEGWTAHFHASHAERYGYRRDGTPVEAVTLRVVVTAPSAPLAHPTLEASSGAPRADSVDVVFGGERHQARSIWRQELGAGDELDGPLVVQEYSGTTWVPPGWVLSVDAHGCLHLTREPT